MPGHYLVMNPEWQRGHVWTPKQQTAFMEYFLRGGKTGREVYFNCSSWQGKYNTPIYCVDGLQRITAALAFLSNEIPVWGHYLRDFEDRIHVVNVSFAFNVLKISSKRDLLKTYIDFNSGGTPHNPQEIARIEEMMSNTSPEEKV
jgi:hypothetical protein